METATRLTCSLHRPRLERLVVCLGYVGRSQGAARVAVGTRVGHLLLQRCRPSPSDVQDPDAPRVHGRDAAGQERGYYAAYTRATARASKRSASSKAAVAALRAPQTWDSAPRDDFMGLWCSRLLLGHHQSPSRTALLEPRVPPELLGESIDRVVRCHRYLRAADVLFVCAAPDLPLGILRQETGDVEKHVTAALQAATSVAHVPGSVGLPAALQRLGPSPTGPTALLVGVGNHRGLLSAFWAEEEARVAGLLLPLAAFATALWTIHPERSGAYVAEQTPTAASLTHRTANQRLWRTMQAAMLSTRDAALLEAHQTGRSLDARLSPQHQGYLARTLLQRLEERETR